MNQISQDKIRNVAIIAHVDHGKTTLVDAFIKQSKVFRDNQEEMQQEMILDSNELEREKGITILAKNIAIRYKDVKINIIDTPGHADFGGEVERTLNMADGCILVVDAQEGPMPQTEFVLKKALELKLVPIVLINKIDKKFANPAKALNKVYDLFLNLVVDEAQLEFPVLYGIGREGKVFKELPTQDLTIPNTIPGTIQPLLDVIIERIPAPKGNPDEGFQMQITSLEYDAHAGRSLIGRINRGKAVVGKSVVVVSQDIDEEGNIKNVKAESGKIKQLFVREGLANVEVNEAVTGDIIAISGIESTAIGATLCDFQKPEALSHIKISPPAVKIRMEQNTSPFAGREGTMVTAKQIEQRLDKEKAINIGLKIEKGEGGSYDISGRGELQLSILIETMRREGYEFQVRSPEVIFQMKDGVKCEPIEKMYVDVPEAYLGTVTNLLSQRGAQMENMTNEGGQIRFVYKILTRKMFGLRNALLTATKGTSVINSFLFDYVPYNKEDITKRNGVLISGNNGVAMGYSLNTIQERGDLFIHPSTELYEGMIIGISKYETDLEVNAIKARHQSAVRMKHDEITQTALKAVIPLTLEYALVFLAKDEMLEVTPKSLRLRKVFLTATQREWAKRKNLTVFAKQQMGIKE